MEKKVILIIRDGWGYREERALNMIKESNTSFTDELMEKYPNTLIKTSGESVGLPEGYQGNSEVGHMTIGSGRILFSPFARINKSIQDRDFFKNKEFLNAINNCKKYKTFLHIIGLIQVEGVHSHLDHLFAILDLCKKENFSDVCIHAITDGRDSPPTNSIKNIIHLTKKLKKLNFGKISTISGRYFAMDRDNRWERTKIAYDCIVKGISEEKYSDALKQIKECYNNNETDEFIKPRKLQGYNGINKNDSAIFFNFRTDRTRQLTKAIVEKEFDGWDRVAMDVNFTAMTQFYSPMNAHVAFKEQSISKLLGEVISNNGLKQLRISETEKYAHVTFFFNCQKEEAYKNEDRILIPSPKVATYDLLPEMSVYEIAERLVEEIKKDKYNLIVANLVNCDMVGHTGDFEAIKIAVNSVDNATSTIVEAGLKNGYTHLIFADHGNAEDKSPAYQTSHTTNNVPLIIVSNDFNLDDIKFRNDGGLSDIAPTVLDILDIKKPDEMTGRSLIL